ncbi:hypothetical protein WA158_004060 [Blastocystis sp. Blastoise]
MGCCQSKPDVASEFTDTVHDESGNEQSVKQKILSGDVASNDGCSIVYNIPQGTIFQLPNVVSGYANITCINGRVCITENGVDTIVEQAQVIQHKNTDSLFAKPINCISCSIQFDGQSVQTQHADGFVVEKSTVQAVKHEDQIERLFVAEKDDVAFKELEMNELHLLVLILNDLKSTVNLVNMSFPIKESDIKMQDLCGKDKRVTCFIVFIKKNPVGIATIVNNHQNKDILEISYMLSSSLKGQVYNYGVKTLMLLLYYIKKNRPCETIAIQCYERNTNTVELLKSLHFVENNDYAFTSLLNVEEKVIFFKLGYEHLDDILINFK